MIFSSHRLLDFVLLQYCYPLRYRAPKPISMCIPHDKISLIHIGAGAQRLRAALSRHRNWRQLYRPGDERGGWSAGRFQPDHPMTMWSRSFPPGPIRWCAKTSHARGTARNRPMRRTNQQGACPMAPANRPV